MQNHIRYKKLESLLLVDDRNAGFMQVGLTECTFQLLHIFQRQSRLDLPGCVEKCNFQLQLFYSVFSDQRWIEEKLLTCIKA